jgi:prepilin-type processing-associated H-X9-DG protein
MYPEEHNGIIVLNSYGGAIPPPVTGWASGWLDWTSSTQNTNVLYLIDARYALLASYVHGASNFFKCPADDYRSTAQRALGWSRVRSYSVNIYIGEGNAPNDPIYKHVRKVSEFLYPPPTQAAVFLDEHPDTINDPAFLCPQQTNWPDVPATYHDGGAVVAFADGHTEEHKWKGSLTTGQVAHVNSNYSFNNYPAPAGDQDISWMSYHTPRVSSQSY